MDGIFGGKNEAVNIRDFQWKTFTPMQLNMDGWGANEKYPHALGEPATSINRMYLKMKSELMPYAYSFAKVAVDGMPMIRAMFLDHPNEYTHGTATQYQFIYGTDFLVAPIYQETKVDKEGNDIRNGIYLPEGSWIDYFSGEVYEGNCVVNNFDTPIWKLPVFVKNGAIIPMTNPNNNVSEIDKSLRIYELYPYKHTATLDYDDDGVTEAYRKGESVTTLIESEADAKNRVTITIHPAKGSFDGFVKEKATELRINVTEKPKKLSAKMNNKNVKLTEVASLDEFLKGENVYWYEEAPNLNKFATKGSEFEKVVITKNPQLRVRLASTDITASPVIVKVEGFRFEPADRYRVTTGTLTAPKNAQVTEENREAYTLQPTWDKVANADFYEIEFNGMLYTTIRDTYLLFEDLAAETPYTFKVRAVNKDGVSDWATINVTTKSNPLEFAIKGIEGDINDDGKIDRNDLTSYMNYTGLRRGDSDYEGYISKGDINMNDLIDAYDISVVATQLDGGVGRKDTVKVSGALTISTPKKMYQKDEIVEILVKGNDLKAVNAFSFALPYDQNDYEFVGVEPLNMKAMENLTYDRLHTNGVKSLYPTFVNLGKQEQLEGSEDLFILKLKAKRKVQFDLTLKDGMLVDKQLRMRQF